MADKPAVLFDVDGTLVDSNYLHVYAWCRAFDEAGIAVEAWRIHRSIGMDGERLIESLSGGADRDAQRRAKDRHLRYLEEAAPLLRPLPGVRELLERLRSLGLQVVLASSAGEDELSMSRRVLGCGELEEAGAEAVFENPLDLSDHIERTSIARLTA
jgi:phosphoglycolate phosphatase-like HAD superfamily hydrolase